MKEADVSDDNPLGWTRFISRLRLADDVLEELRAEPTDVVVADTFLSAGLTAAEKAGVPGVALCKLILDPTKDYQRIP